MAGTSKARKKVKKPQGTAKKPDPAVATDQPVAGADLADNSEQLQQEQKAAGPVDIDDIFKEAKTKKQETAKRKEAASGEAAATSEEQGESSKAHVKRKKTTAAGRIKAQAPTSGGQGPASSRPRKRTADGYTVYSEEELKWNKKKAGGTKLCPFDCACCF